MRAKFVFDPCFSLKTAVNQLPTVNRGITSLAERKSNAFCVFFKIADSEKEKKQQDYLVKYQTKKNFPTGIIFVQKKLRNIVYCN